MWLAVVIWARERAADVSPTMRVCNLTCLGRLNLPRATDSIVYKRTLSPGARRQSHPSPRPGGHVNSAHYPYPATKSAMAAAVAKPGQALRRARPSLNTKHSTRSAAVPTAMTDSANGGSSNGIGGLVGDDGAPKRLSEPYVRDTNHILLKFSGRPPSLIVHLHPTHFRFDQQDGSFGYDSPMKAFLHHLRQQTIPHDFLEELLENQVPFYDGTYRYKFPCPSHTS